MGAASGLEMLGVMRGLIPRRGPDGRREYVGMPLGMTVRYVSHGKDSADDSVELPQPSVPLPFAPRLNQTEIGIVEHLANGKCFYEIAWMMNTSNNAIYQHCHRIYDKLGARTAAGAVGRAFRLGIIK